MSAVTADYDECTCIGGRCMRKEQSYAYIFLTMDFACRCESVYLFHA